MSKKKEWWEKLEKIEFVPEKGKQIRLRAGVRYWLVNDEWIAQARLKERERVVEEIEGTGLVLMEQELKLGKGGELVEMGENKVVEPDNYVKGYNRAVSDILAQLKTKKK